MLKNYFKTAIRNLMRNRAFAIINILGLVLGISGTIVIYRIITFENSFDRYHQSAERTYRINLSKDVDGVKRRGRSVMHPLRMAVRSDFPDWKVAGIHWWGDGIVTVENDQGAQKKIRETGSIAFVEPDFFHMFDYEVIAGSPEHLLEEPNTIVMSATSADKLFDLNGDGYQSVIGKTVNFENKLTLRLQAVYADPPKNTDFGMDYLMSYEGARIYPYAQELKSWTTVNGAARLWVQLPEGVSRERAESLLLNSSEKYLSGLGGGFLDDVYMSLEPLAGIHLDEETGSGGTINTGIVRSMKVLALILIITAAINFINLATAQSVKRAKEIGIRKVLGSNKPQLVVQFLGEVFIITSLSVLISLGISEGALMQLEPLLGYNLGLNLVTEPSIVLFLLLLILTVTLLAGFYPSMVLARYNPVHAIKSNKLDSRANAKGLSVRRGLVVLQFLISQTLIIGTLVVVYQMNYMENKDLGFQSEGVLTFNIPDRSEEKMELLKTRLSGIIGAEEISFYIASPGGARTNNTDGIKDPKGQGDETFTANRKNVDHNYADLFDLSLVAGEFYRPESPADNSVINRAFSEQLGYQTPEEAIGQRYETAFGRNYLIVGVVEDFHNYSLRSAIQPVFMMSGSSNYFEGGIRLTVSSDFSGAIDQVDEIWSDVFPEDVFSYQFLEERVDAQYDVERQVSALLQVFAGLAIFIGCLGLYGLVSFMANQKVKEIGIRKVLGASVRGIMGIFSKEVMVLVAISFLLAAPVGYYAMSQWLANYVYSINIGVSVFLLSILATVVIATGTVGYKAFKAATINPVQALRDE